MFKHNASPQFEITGSVALWITAIIGLAVLGLGIFFAVLRMNPSPQVASTTSATSTPAAAPVSASPTPATVDTSLQDIDKSLNTLDTTNQDIATGINDQAQLKDSDLQ